MDTGEATTAYCVALPSSSVSGIELIQLAGEQHGLDYSLGYGGGAVCRLEGVGPDGQDCFAEHPDFWGYWRGDGSGGWAWSGTGAGSTSVEAGDVEGWSWGSGQDGASHQQPPATSYSSVCAASPDSSASDGGEETKDPDKPSPKADSGGGAVESEGAGAAAVAEDGSPAKRRGSSKERVGKEPKKKGRTGPKDANAPDEAASSPQPDLELAAETAAAAEEDSNIEDGGAPVAGLAGLGLTALLGAAGLLVRGRRRRDA